jgi:hypothetical protein
MIDRYLRCYKDVLTLDKVFSNGLLDLLSDHSLISVERCTVKMPVAILKSLLELFSFLERVCTKSDLRNLVPIVKSEGPSENTSLSDLSLNVHTLIRTAVTKIITRLNQL